MAVRPRLAPNRCRPVPVRVREPRNRRCCARARVPAAVVSRLLVIDGRGFDCARRTACRRCCSASARVGPDLWVETELALDAILWFLWELYIYRVLYSVVEYITGTLENTAIFMWTPGCLRNLRDV